MSNSKKELRTLEEYQVLVEEINNQTEITFIETTEEKEERIKKLLDNFEDFCKYYFARYFDSDFAWFHKAFSKEVINNENFFGVAEFPRDHAKSVLCCIFLPLYLKSKGELTGMILASSNKDKATTLLSDIQAELEGNKLYINDFGEQVSLGNWQTGYFKTKDGLGFWSFGRGQSPRGARKAQLRPNLGVVDDIDDKDIVKNQERVNDAVEWVFEDFYGCLDTRCSRFLMAGNRIHKKSILANVVGDVENNDPKREGIYHLKVYAIENPITHEKAGEHNGKPAWSSRYTIKMLLDKWKPMPYRSVRREYFHEHIVEGLVFKNKWIIWGKVLPLHKYDKIVTYCDPSFTNNPSSDYKAIVTIGKKGKYYHILWAWVRQASIHSMVVAFHDAYEIFKNFSTYWIEANMLQDKLQDDFDEEADIKGFAIPLRKDKTKKPHKFTRIENLSPSFERKLYIFNEELQNDKDMQTLKDQILAFGGSGHDDGPDAVEGATTKLNKATKKQKFKPRTGKYKKRRRR